jgi:hypothetical protein
MGTIGVFSLKFLSLIDGRARIYNSFSVSDLDLQHFCAQVTRVSQILVQKKGLFTE